MNEQERKIMELLCQVHNEFVKLEQTHPNDIKNWVSSVHRMQDIISCRIVRRDYPDDFATYIKNKDTDRFELKNATEAKAMIEYDKKHESCNYFDSSTHSCAHVYQGFCVNAKCSYDACKYLPDAYRDGRYTADK